MILAMLYTSAKAKWMRFVKKNWHAEAPADQSTIRLDVDTATGASMPARMNAGEKKRPPPMPKRPEAQPPTAARSHKPPMLVAGISLSLRSAEFVRAMRIRGSAGNTRKKTLAI